MYDILYIIKLYIIFVIQISTTMKSMRSVLLCSLLMLMISSSHSQVRTGIEVLRDRDFDILRGKKVGLVTNPTGVDAELRSTIDILHEAVDLVALFGPEHGVRGDFSAGDHVGDAVDEATGIPVYSLYGSDRKPKYEQLSGLDVIVYDIQDVGVRSYTYISTLGLVMEAAAEAEVQVIVLDRPNPLGGTRIEGPGVEEGFFSFVSQFDIPYIYGLTVGELARMLNEERMLDGTHCELMVIKMDGWDRDMIFEDTGLPWVPTSPHIPDAKTALFYPVTGIIGELDPNMIGIGYTLPFQLLATESLDAAALARSMNALELAGVEFRPIHFKPYYMAKKGKPMQGVQVHLLDPRAAALTEIQFYFLQEAHKLDPDFNPFQGKENRFGMFDKVCGTDQLRLELMKDFDFERLAEWWNRDVAEFREKAEFFDLYTEQEIPW